MLRHIGALFASAAVTAVLVFSPALAIGGEPFKVVTGPDFRPFTDPSLPNGGLLTEIVTAAFAEAGVAIAPIEFLPWKRGYGDTLERKVDATFPYLKSAEREGEMEFSDSAYDVRAVAVFAADSNLDYTGPESLKGRSICLPLGYDLKATVDNAEVTVGAQPRDLSQCAKIVAAHRADFFVENTFTVRQIIKEQDAAKDLKIASQPIHSNSNHVIVAKSHPKAKEILAAFNEGLAKLKASGKYNEIVTRHLGSAD